MNNAEMQSENTMKKYTKILILFLTLIPFITKSQTVNGRFIVLEHSATSYTIKVQINGDTNTQFLGTSTVIFNFDSTSISYPNNPVEGQDYSFANFSTGNYSTAKITRPKSNEIWLNID